MGTLCSSRFPLEPAPLPETIVRYPVAMPFHTAGPAHDYAFWERQWDKQGDGANLIALRTIAERRILESEPWHRVVRYLSQRATLR
jgi:hypothetical protein